MKWLKHFTDSLDDPFIHQLMQKYRSDGYLVYWGTLEIIAKEFDIHNPGFCQIPSSFLRKKLGVSRKKLEQILDFCGKKKKIYAEFLNDNCDEIKIYCPKLKELCDEWTKKNLKELRSKSRESPHIEEEEEEEEE